MAPLQEVSVHKPPCSTVKNICSFVVCSFYDFYHYPWLFLVLFFQSWSAFILYFHKRQTRRPTGSLPARNLADEDSSSRSKVRKGGSEISPLSNSSTSRVKEKERLLRRLDSGESMKSKYSADHLPCLHSMTNSDRVEIPDECSTLGIQDIVSLLQLANYKSRNLNITADERKDINGSFLSLGKFYAMVNYKI